MNLIPTFSIILPTSLPPKLEASLGPARTFEGWVAMFPKVASFSRHDLKREQFLPIHTSIGRFNVSGIPRRFFEKAAS